ncbi:MAG TPA: T9SS type A sorting domain-containing protein [Puia sp.]|nr:T9SS type A sorting domain-containing protein [Puia sp.]
MYKFYVALLFVFAANVLQAQSPGGVSTNLTLWLKPDGLATGTLSTWTYSNNANSFTATAGQEPTVTSNVFNFLPAVTFSGAQLMSGPTLGSAPIPAGQDNYTVFAVWSSSVSGANERIWSQRPNSSAGDANSDGASLWIFGSGNAYGDQAEIPPSYTTGLYFTSTSVAITPYAANTPYISMMGLLNQNTNDLQLMDQNNYATGPGIGQTDPSGNSATLRNIVADANLIGARSTALDEPFTGNLAELIVYAGTLTTAQQDAVFSYLSVKYGIPLNGNYVSSTGSRIWDATAAASWGFGSMNYNHFVFGLGKDNGSGLSVSQSNSLSTGSGSGSGQSGQGNIVLANPSNLSDGGFMMIGSNNAGFAETTTNLPPTSPVGAKRLATQWLVQNTGTVGTVDLSFDFTGITTTGTIGTSSDFALVVDNNGDGDFTTGTQSVYAPTSWNGNVATWSGVTLNASTPVVLSILSNSNGTPLPVNWVNFGARANGPDIDLSWTVSANEHANNYEVQHSTDGQHFTTIGTVSNQADVKSYGFVHANAGPGTHYYRVLETDLDGKSIYSKIVSVNLSGSDFAIRLLNNPVVGSNMDAELEITAGNAGSAALEIWTLSGTRVSSIMQDIPNGTSRIRLPMANLATGTYAVKIRVNDVTQTVQVVKLQ